MCDYGVTPTRFFLPQNVDMHKWSVIACDQFTAQRTYWQQLDALIGDAPSALRMILPEVYLQDDDAHRRIDDAVHTMHAYLDAHILRQGDPCVMYVRRTIASGVRCGVVAAIDLTCYEPDGSGVIRPTEGTIASRVPPRMRVRQDAPLELSHVMLLCDDARNVLFDTLARCAQDLTPAYDFPLNMDGGRLCGYAIASPAHLQMLEDAFCTAAADAHCRNGADAPFLVVGDGNHSLAAAKAHWEALKKAGAPCDHPARWAMVEIVNIHDPAVCFAPIHRIVLDCDVQALCEAMVRAGQKRGITVRFDAAQGSADSDTLCVPCLLEGHAGTLLLTDPAGRWAVHVLQEILDDVLRECSGARLDYIHGDDALRTLASRPGCAGFFLPATDKHSFFRMIGQAGALPRKTFSIGQATEKRYYTEARAIRPLQLDKAGMICV